MKSILFVLLLFIANTIAAQQPSKKDMDKAMAEYEKMMNDPQLKKTLDSMGIKMGSSQTVRKQLEYASKNTSAQQMNLITGEETIPSKDIARINALPKTILSDAAFSDLLHHIRTAASNKISDQSKKIADQLYQATKKQNSGTAELASMANGLWMKGYAELGLELMGRAVAEDVNDADNLNSYAVFLSTLGGEQLALPILQKLNSRYPDNSTILNNIGQAWFGLGDINTSKKYLDSAIHFFGMHSQANYTKAVIEESKGNKQGAADAMKISLQNGFSPAKAKRLEKLQGDIAAGDIGWNFPKPADALGLEKLRAQRPDFYFSVDDAIKGQPKWSAFQDACSEKLDQNQDELEKLVEAARASMMKMIETKGASAAHIGKSGTNIFIAKKASVMATALRREQSTFTLRMEAKSKKMCESFPGLRNELSLKLRAISDKYMNEYYKKQEDDGNKYDKFEGDNSHPEKLLREAQEKICRESKPLLNAFYSYANRILSDLSKEWVDKELYYTNEIVYYSKYGNTDENQYQVEKHLEIGHFLNVIGRLADTQPLYIGGVSCKDKDEKPQSMKLADYDELHCDNHITLYVPKVGVSHWDCNIETDTLNLGAGGFEFDGNYKENLANGKKSWHAELGYKQSVGSKTAGPVKAGASVSGGAFVEGDETGVTDAGVTVKGTVKVGSSASVPGVTTSTSVGIEGRVGFNSGPSLSGKGGLSGISIK